MRHHTSLHGAAWSALHAGSAVFLPMMIFIVFARLLSPMQIGLVALATSCAEIIKTCGLSGLYETLMQHSDTPTDNHETATALLLALSLPLIAIYEGVLYFLSYHIDGLYQALPVVSWIGLRIFFDLVGLQPQAYLAQQLAFRRLALRGIIANSVAGGIGLFCAMLHHPLAGIVLFQVAQSALALMVTVMGTTALARPRLHQACWQKMRHETMYATGTRLISATNNYLDQVLIATLADSTKLAYFNVAKRLETAFITAGSSFSSILFQPLFAQLQVRDHQQNMRLALMTLTITCGFPTMFLIVHAQQVIPWIFGEQWRPAIPVVVLLSISGYARVLGSVHGARLSVSGRNRTIMLLAGSSTVLGLAIVALTMPYGLVACAACLTVKSIMFTAAFCRATLKDMPSPLWIYGLDIAFPLLMMLAGCAIGDHMVSCVSEASALARIGLLSASASLGLICGLASMALRVKTLLRIRPC